MSGATSGRMGREKEEGHEDRTRIEDLAVPVVRRPGRGGRELLRLGVLRSPSPGGRRGRVQGPGRLAVRRGRSGARGHGDDDRLPARGTGVRRAERRARVHVHAGDLVRRELRDAGRGRRPVGDPVRGWHPGRVRLAGGPVRRVVADRADRARRAAHRPRPRTLAARDARACSRCASSTSQSSSARPGRRSGPDPPRGLTFFDVVPYPRASEARADSAPRGGPDAQEPVRGDGGPRPGGRRRTGRDRGDGDGADTGRLHRHGVANLDRVHIVDDVARRSGARGGPDRDLPDHGRRQRTGLGRAGAVPHPQHQRGRPDDRQQPRSDSLRPRSDRPELVLLPVGGAERRRAPHANLIRLQWRSPSGEPVSMLRGDMAVLYRTDGCDGSS